MKSPYCIAGVNELLDTIIRQLDLKNDAALSRTLDVAPPVISKLRHGRMALGPSILVRIHEETGLTVRQMKSILGAKAPEVTVAATPAVLE